MSKIDATSLYEGQVETKSTWLELVGGSLPDIEHLISIGVLSKSNNRDKFRLNLVGVINTNEMSYFCFPKIFGNQHFQKACVIRDVVRIIEKYKALNTRLKNESSVDPAEFHETGRKIIDHLLGLIYWTRDNHFHSESIKLASDEGRIDWRKTIRSSLAIAQDDYVIYIDPVTDKTRRQLSDVAFAQAFVILDLVDKIGLDILSIWVDPMDNVLRDSKEILAKYEGHISRSEVSQIIQDFHGNATRDDDRDLSQFLFQWDQRELSAGRNVSIYGFCAFHTVWEDMCRSIYPGLLGTLNHKSVASQAVYALKDSQFDVSPQMPDILFEIDDNIYIGDAKWYSFDDNNFPKLADVVKQLFYELSVLSDVCAYVTDLSLG